MLENMDGREVFHTKFGTGKIISNRAGIISVQFEKRPIRFVYPEVFVQFLSTDDAELNEQVQSDIKRRQGRRIAHTADTGANASQKGSRRDEKDKKTSVAFKCNYCDGGAEQGGIGFGGVCCGDTIHYNIGTVHRVWCSDVDCPCKQYLDGKINRVELCDSFDNGALVCYESTMLKDWKASAGRVQNGINRDKPMRIVNARVNSLAVLTTRKPHEPDTKRFIFAVFLVGEAFVGDKTEEEGYVKANSKWKIELSPQEASKILFWNYYVNENQPERIALGSGLYRYLSDNQAVQILRDIIKVKTNPSEKEFAQAFLNYFCTVNGIDESAVPQPNGALLRGNG